MKEAIGIYLITSIICHLAFVAGIGDFLSDYQISSKFEKIVHWYVFLTPITFLLCIPICILSVIVTTLYLLGYAIRVLVMDITKAWLKAKDKIL